MIRSSLDALEHQDSTNMTNLKLAAETLQKQTC